LLDAAGQVFAERGFHGATLDDVAATAGVSKGALYHYFDSKEAVFLALLRERLGAGLADVAAVVAERGTGSAEMASAAETFLRRVTRDPRWMPLLLEFLAYGSREPAARQGVVENFLRPARERVADLIRDTTPELQGASALSADELGLVIAALINGLAIERTFEPRTVPKDLLPKLLGVIRAGLEAGGPSTPPKTTSRTRTTRTKPNKGGRDG
jgi:AcrR family transcriptional regulator